MSNGRSPEEIRGSIEQHREHLGVAVERLRAEVDRAMDWRRHLREHQQQVVLGAAAAGFVLGGGIAGVAGLFRRRR